jgi:hypothetical protein
VSVRVLPALLGLTLLALPASAATVERLSVEVGYPTPGARAVLWEDPSCATHALLWEGVVFTGSDLTRWAVGEDEREPGQLTDRLMVSYFWANGWATREAFNVTRNTGPWAARPGSAEPWAVEQIGHEDVCMLSLASVEDGVAGP